jgi:nicotinamidase-related amidase
MTTSSPLDPPSTALLLVDIQKAFDHPRYWGTSRSTPQFEDNITKLIATFRGLKAKAGNEGEKPLIVHVYHRAINPKSPLHPENGDGMEFMAYARPEAGEPVISKEVNSGFIGTNLGEVLREWRIRQLVVCGLTTDHCVSTTVRMAANLGVVNGVDEQTGKQEAGRVILVEDAVGTFAKGGWDAETVHAVNIASLRDEFAEVMNTEEVVRRLV